MGAAVFHYLGPSFAVLLFAVVPVAGVAWLRIDALPLGPSPRSSSSAPALPSHTDGVPPGHPTV